LFGFDDGLELEQVRDGELHRGRGCGGRCCRQFREWLGLGDEGGLHQGGEGERRRSGFGLGLWAWRIHNGAGDLELDVGAGGLGQDVFGGFELGDFVEDGALSGVFGVDQLPHVFVNGALRQDVVDVTGFGLARAVDAILGLEGGFRAPLGVEDDDVVGAGDGDAPVEGAGAGQEDGVAASLEFAYHVVALFGGDAVNLGDANAGSEKRFEEGLVEALEAGENDHLLAGGVDGFDQVKRAGDFDVVQVAGEDGIAQLEVVQGGAALCRCDRLRVEADAERAGVVERACDGGTGGGVAAPPQGHRDDAHIRVVAFQLAFERVLHRLFNTGVDAAVVRIQGNPVLLDGFGRQVGEEVFLQATDRKR